MRSTSKFVCFLCLISALLVANISCKKRDEPDSVTKEDVEWNRIRWKPSRITIQEGERIRQIGILVDRYKDPNYEEKEKVLDSICALYKEYQNAFLGIVLLDNLMSIRKIDVLPEPKTIVEREFLAFAKFMQTNEDGLLPYLNNVKDPGLRGFLMVWYAWYNGVDKLPKELKLSRLEKVERLKTEIRNSIKNLSNIDKVKFLLNIVENWQSPLEYEACFPLILAEYETNPDFISSQLKQLFVEHTPRKAPPPYSRNHTVFHEICLIAIIANDKGFLEIMSTMTTSTNPYVALKCSETLKWLQQEVRYPFKYEYLKMAYDSRS